MVETMSGLWISLTTVLLCEGLLASPSVRTVFYLHTRPRTWNEAKLICEAETAELFRVWSDSTLDQLQFVDQLPEWKGNFTKLLSTHRIWLSLYETQDNSNPYLHHGCIKPQGYYNWESGAPVPSPAHEYCVSMDSKFSWNIGPCNESYIFICQRHDGDCWFDPKDDKIGTAQTFSVDDVTVEDEAECATSCRNGWINNTECWGFSFHKTQMTCRLHFHNVSTIYIKEPLSNLQTNEEWIFYAKICLGGLLRSVTVNYVNEDDEPFVVNCTELATLETDWDNSICYCECQNPPPMWIPTISTLTLEQKIQELIQALTIDAKNTSSAHRKLISVYDERPSAQSIGYVGIVILSVVFGSIIVLDLNVLLSQTHNLVKKMKTPTAS